MKEINIMTEHIKKAKKIPNSKVDKQTGLYIEDHMAIDDNSFRQVLYIKLMGEMTTGNLYMDTDILASVYIYDKMIGANMDIFSLHDVQRVFNTKIAYHSGYFSVSKNGSREQLLSAIGRKGKEDKELFYILFFINQYITYFDYNNKDEEVIKIIDRKLEHYKDVLDTTELYLKTKDYYNKSKSYLREVYKNVEEIEEYRK